MSSAAFDIETVPIRNEQERRAFFEAMCFPNIKHAYNEHARQVAFINTERARLHRLLTSETDTHPLARYFQTPGWQWREARVVCADLRKLRARKAEAWARVERMRAPVVSQNERKAA